MLYKILKSTKDPKLYINIGPSFQIITMTKNPLVIYNELFSLYLSDVHFVTEKVL